MSSYEMKAWLRDVVFGPIVYAYGFGSLFIIGFALAAVGLIWWYKFSGFHSPKYNRRLGKSPKPRNNSPWTYFAIRLADWKSGIAGPNGELGHRIAYVGHHLLSVNKQQAVLRLELSYYRRTAIIWSVFGVLWLSFTLYILDDYRKFHKRGGGRCVEFIQTDSGWQHQAPYIKDRSFTRYLYTRYCSFTYTLHPNSHHPTVVDKIDSLTNLRFSKFYVWIIATLLLIYSTLRPVPAPLVADRKNRLLYTHHKGQLYLADWDSLAFSIESGMYFRHTLSVQLFTHNKRGQWQPRWFSLAEHPYAIREWRNNYIANSEIAFHRDWAQRCWLLRYMELGPSAVHGVMHQKGLYEHLSFRQRELPKDITEQVLAAVAANDGKAPVDEDFVNTPKADTVKQLLNGPDKLERQYLPDPVS